LQSSLLAPFQLSGAKQAGCPIDDEAIRFRQSSGDLASPFYDPRAISILEVPIKPEGSAHRLRSWQTLLPSAASFLVAASDVHLVKNKLAQLLAQMISHLRQWLTGSRGFPISFELSRNCHEQARETENQMPLEPTPGSLTTTASDFVHYPLVRKFWGIGRILHRRKTDRGAASKLLPTAVCARDYTGILLVH
jgi:hypothetical protein